MKLEEITSEEKEEIMEKFKDFPFYSQDKPMEEVQVVSRFFVPTNHMVWLLYEGNVEGDDFIMFGWCRNQEDELGYVSLNELIEVGVVFLDERKPMGKLNEMIEEENKGLKVNEQWE